MRLLLDMSVSTAGSSTLPTPARSAGRVGRASVPALKLFHVDGSEDFGEAGMRAASA
jgi:hypothetical protein